jgi:hypothetical protein
MALNVDRALQAIISDEGRSGDWARSTRACAACAGSSWGPRQQRLSAMRNT